MAEDAIIRIQSMTKAITSVAALRLVEAGRLQLDQSLVDWLPELADREVLRSPAAELDDAVPEHMWPLIEQFQSLHEPSLHDPS